MDNHESVNFRNERKRSKPSLLGIIQLITRPLDSGFGQWVEAFQGAFRRSVIIMVSLHNGTLERLYQLQTLPRIRIIAYYVPEAEISDATLINSVSDHSFQHF